MSALFGNIEDLLTLNSVLLSELETCQNNPTRIAEAFVTRVSFGERRALAVYVSGCLVFQASDFSVYSAYCTNYPRAVAILTLWQHTPQITENSPKVTQFLKVHLSVCLSVCLCVCLSVCLSIHLVKLVFRSSCVRKGFTMLCHLVHFSSNLCKEYSSTTFFSG